VGIDYAMKLNKIVIPCLPSIQLYCCNVVCYIVNHRVYDFNKNILMKFYFALMIYKKKLRYRIKNIIIRRSNGLG